MTTEEATTKLPIGVIGAVDDLDDEDYNTVAYARDTQDHAVVELPGDTVGGVDFSRYAFVIAPSTTSMQSLVQGFAYGRYVTPDTYPLALRPFMKRRIDRMTVHDFLTRESPCTMPFFVKPCGQNKQLFDGLVVRDAHALAYVRDQCRIGVTEPNETSLYVCEEVVFENEVRVAVMHGMVCFTMLVNGSLSQYDRTVSLMEFSHDVANAMSQDSGSVDLPMYVVDIGYIQGRGWAVVEVNPPFSFRWYTILSQVQDTAIHYNWHCAFNRVLTNIKRRGDLRMAYC